MPPYISVVVPYYNAERFLEKCIAGLRAQSFPRDEYEIILVDNNSTDGSAAIASQGDGVRHFTQPISGSYAARNLGIRESRGEIIATIDPDCFPDPDWLSQIAAGMKDQSCLILLGHLRHVNRSEALSVLEMYESEKVAYITERREPELYFGYTNNMAFRRKLFDEMGLFPERVRGGDTLFVRRAVDKLGCDIVRYNPDMHTTHLELDTLGAYYTKRLIYGKSNDRLGDVVPFRPLSNIERWTVFQRAVAKGKFPFGKKLMVFSLLLPGALLYEAGRRSGIFRKLKS